MAANKTPVTQLQRRGGRRVSIPSSPVAERGFFDKTPQSSSAAVVDMSLESPSADLKTPPPAFVIPGFSGPGREQSPNRLQHDSKDYQPSWQQSVGTQDYSPQMSSPASDIGYRYSPFGSQPDGMIKSSPLTSQYRDSPDNVKWSDPRPRTQDRPSSAARNLSSSSVLTSDRSVNDENPSRTTTTKKSRLNLLNPMSLLARRRSSQNTKLDESSVTPLQVPAIPDFDPRIRGKIVHDFSAPRLRTPRRDVPPSPVNQFSSENNTPRPQVPSSPALHSPMFKEHFQDDDATLQPARTAYLHNVPMDPPVSNSLPAFAQKLPSEFPSRHTTAPQPLTSNQPQTPDDGPPSPPPKSTPPLTVETSIPAHLPKHMKSTSSRFSFQISGQGSAAQERLLEDRHRQRYPEGLDEHPREADDDDENYYPDLDDGLEESIPGVNTGFDVDEDGFGTDDIPVRDINLQTSRLEDTNDADTIHTTEVQSLADHSQTSSSDSTEKRRSLGFRFTPQSMTLSPTSPLYASQFTPRDSQGFPIGVADTKYSPTFFDAATSSPGTNADQQSQIYFDGLRISTGDIPNSTKVALRTTQTFDDVDLYFDDGDFGIDTVDTTSPFDEDLLDDENHLRDIPAENARRYEAALYGNPVDRRIDNANATSASATRSSTTSLHDERAATHHPKTTAKITLSSKVPSLTEDNLAAYHDALATAATNAASEGRFNRQVSFSEASAVAEEVPWSSSQSGLVSDESRYSLNMGMGTFPDDDSFRFDDDGDFDDDLMIAEANAEALENDDDGFYGSEFGFYARAYGKDQPDSVNGGYFTSRGSNGIKRSHSGKADFQEPSLTPITERSEWSARNSVVSLQFHPGMPNLGQSQPSPGLGQLMDSPALEDEMTLSGLMKLRRGAFGGSSTSINSLGERSLPNSSPLSHVSGFKFPQTDPLSTRINAGHPLLPGTVSILESEEEEEDGERPTMTQNTPRKMRTDLAPRTPEPSNGNLKVETPATSKKGHHSRNSSGAESVSYARDDDGRWILERRRTGDDGELELVAREYLAGARI